MTEEEEKRANQWKGARKVALGISTFIFPVGKFVFSAGVVSAVGGTILRGLGWASGSKKLSDWGKNFQSMGIKAMTTGFAMSNPFTGAALLCEGGYNAYTGKQSTIGFEPMARSAARFVTGLPQFGDDDYVNSRTGWQNSKEKLDQQAQENSQLPPQQKQKSVDSPTRESVDESSKSKASSPPHPAAGSLQPKFEPTVKGSIDIKEVAKAKTFEDASKAYADQVNKAGARKFEVLDIKKEGEHTIITYVPPDYKDRKEECPKELKVTQTFDKNGHLVKVEPGEKATCITPPVKKDRSFEIHSYQDGKPTDEKSAVQKQAALRRSSETSRESSVGHIPAPTVVNNGKARQRSGSSGRKVSL